MINLINFRMKQHELVALHKTQNKALAKRKMRAEKRLNNEQNQRNAKANMC